MDQMPIEGGCLCGATRYHITAEPLTLYACHCKDCQNSSGASFLLALRVPGGAVTVVCGEARPYVRGRVNGTQRKVFRCERCLTGLWSERVEPAGFATVYAGTLDDTSQLSPVAHMWVSDAQPWMILPNDVLIYDESPPSMQPLIDAWNRRNRSKA